MKFLKFIFGWVLTLVGGISAIISTLIALGNAGPIHNPAVLIAYGLVIILVAGILLLTESKSK